MDPHGGAGYGVDASQFRRLQEKVEKLEKEIERLKSILKAMDPRQNDSTRRAYGAP